MMYSKIAISAALRVCQECRQISSALMVLKKVSIAALKLLYSSSGHVHARRCAEMAIDFPDDVPFEAPDDLALSLAVGRAFGDLGSCRGMTPHPNDGDAVERRIRLSIAASVQPHAVRLAAGRRDRAHAA